LTKLDEVDKVTFFLPRLSGTVTSMCATRTPLLPPCPHAPCPMPPRAACAVHARELRAGLGG
jgi:hypothetical protein